MNRPRSSAFLAISLDGFVARPDGGLDWLAAVQATGDDYGYARFFASIDALVIGRNTYDVALGFDAWPYGGKRCVVLTHRPVAPRHGEQLVAERPTTLLARLHDEGVRHAYIDGAAVIRQFLTEDVLDELTLSVVPVVLGEGIALFTPGLPERALVLEEMRSWPVGLVQLRYRRAAHGSDV